MVWVNGVRGALLDVDGTLLLDDRAVPGADRFMERLRSSDTRFRVTTNTTRRSVSAVAAALAKAGIRVESSEILAPAILARQRILRSGRTRAALLVPPETREDFEGVQNDATKPDWVVVGDLGPGFTFDRLNEAFRCLREGAALLALQKNRFWHAGAAGWVLDAGPFVAALEYAAGVTAEVVGKPSPTFFELALAELSLSPGEVLVVGDDVETDGKGGAAMGCRTVLVRTGKYAATVAKAGDFHPDLVVDSIADLMT